jgi:hypothetical protein
MVFGSKLLHDAWTAPFPKRILTPMDSRNKEKTKTRRVSERQREKKKVE